MGTRGFLRETPPCKRKEPPYPEVYPFTSGEHPAPLVISTTFKNTDKGLLSSKRCRSGTIVLLWVVTTPPRLHYFYECLYSNESSEEGHAVYMGFRASGLPAGSVAAV